MTSAELNLDAATKELPEAAVEFAFRKLPADRVLPGELHLQLQTSAERHCRQLALQVCDRGVAEFIQGAEPIRRIVLPANPTFDDVLAAACLARLLVGQALPPGMEQFARYAALVREGLSPSAVHVAHSLEGMFSAIRNISGEDLTSDQTARSFIAAWWRMWRRIVQASGTGFDPLTQPLFQNDAEFARERTYLDADHQVFLQDLARGEAWRVSLPGGVPGAKGVLLHAPKSLLFKQFSRTAADVPDGEAFELLAVDGKQGEWTFSTNPIHRLSLLGLHAALQAAERKHDPRRADRDPWFDGKPFAHTLVASPRQGSQLGGSEVLRIVKTWSHARPLRRGGLSTTAPSSLRRWLLPLGLAGSLLCVALIVLLPARAKQADDAPTADTVRGLSFERDNSAAFVSSSPERRVTLPSGASSPISLSVANPWQTARPVKLKVVVHSGAVLDGQIEVTINGHESKSVELHPVGEGAFRSAEIEAEFAAGKNDVELTLNNSGGAPATATLRLEWSVDSSFLPQLYLLAVGISEYQRGNNLKFADQDAEELAAALGEQEGLLFRKVHGEVLTNRQATRDNVIEALARIKNAGVGRHDLVIVMLAGHGEKGGGGRFYFLPYDYDERKQLSSTALPWEDFFEPLELLHCPVLVLVDACHSGAIVEGRRGPSRSELEDSIRAAVERSWHNPEGIAVMAACLGDQFAREKPEWAHGALTLALLEAIRGRRSDGTAVSLGPNPVVTFENVNAYVGQRVETLVGGQQAVVTTHFGGIALNLIPFTTVAPTEK